MGCDKERDAFPQAGNPSGPRCLKNHKSKNDCVVDRLHELERCAFDITPAFRNTNFR